MDDPDDFLRSRARDGSNDDVQIEQSAMSNEVRCDKDRGSLHCRSRLEHQTQISGDVDETTFIDANNVYEDPQKTIAELDVGHCGIVRVAGDHRDRRKLICFEI